MTTRPSRRRFLGLLVGSASSGLLGGCNIFWRKPEAPDIKPPASGPVDTSTLTADRVIAYLNDQAEKVSSVDARDISLTVKGPGGAPPSLTGTLLVQKPRY